MVSLNACGVNTIWIAGGQTRGLARQFLLLAALEFNPTPCP
jgi:hypothetical protein